jgi:UPF0755 protein
MKRFFLICLFLVIVIAVASAWVVLGSATNFDDEKRTLYIRTTAKTKSAVLDSLRVQNIISNEFAFNWIAERMNYWERVKPGKYDIKKGESLLSIIRMLRNGQQTPVNLIITKIRTNEDFARLAGNKFEFDSIRMISFLLNNDSLKPFSALPEQAMSIVLPDTYSFLWTTTPQKIFKKLWDENKKFWNSERLVKAQSLSLSPLQVSILASIVDEETNVTKEKGTVASVYLNRLKKGMPLQADPTVKFALRDFGLKRIYEKHLFTESPYNTYRNRGLPPGPICTPSKKTLDAVLNAPSTNYIYFVASPKFNGEHEFSSSYAEHLIKAKQYQQELNRQDSIRKNR